jgi:hypothetical protein
MTRKQGKRGTLLIIAAGSLWGCGQDCLESRRMGDFEFSQGNYANAVKHYKRALEADTACAGVKAKLTDAEARNR